MEKEKEYIDVIKIIELDSSKCVYRELALIKVSADESSKSSITETVNIFRGNIIDMNRRSMTIELTGDDDKISAFIELMKPFSIKEVARTGLTALERGCTNTK